MFEIFLVFLKLGLTSFGGPIAHIGFFHNEFVNRKKWIEEQQYADLVALCQLLPGPASSQVGMAIGFYRGRILGALFAWLAFTLPSALVLILFAKTMVSYFGGTSLHGLKIAAVAVVAHAIWEMAKKFCSSISKALMAVVAAFAALQINSALIQILIIVIGAIFGILFFTDQAPTPHLPKTVKFETRTSNLFLILFFVFLFLMPVAATQSQILELKIADTFYRVGALVFGGGHVVLPLLQSSVVDSGWVSKDHFTAGYGMAQAVPGPLFSLAAYLGFMTQSWMGALVALVMIFLPSFFLVIGVIPHWDYFRNFRQMKSALIGVNAVVVGLLMAAFYNPIWASAIFNWKDFVLALLAFMVLLFKKAPSYVVVISLAIAASLINL